MTETTLKEPIKTASTGSESLQAEIERLETESSALREKIAKLRKELPAEKVIDYNFKGSLGETVKLSELFGDKSELMVIHNMGRRCTYCTLWADSFIGITKHLEDRVAFVLTSPDDAETQRTFAIERGWNFKMYSTKGTSFKHDMGFEPTPDEVWPGVSVFQKTANGDILHVSKAVFGPGDPYCGLW